MKKLLVVGVIVLFLGLAIAPSTGTIRENYCSINDSNSTEHSSYVMKSDTRGVDVEFLGLLGDNGWYISCVQISFTWTPDVVKIWFYIDGGDWIEYSQPFGPICDDGLYTVCWKYEDEDGNISDIECEDFKIDQTPPTIEILWEQIDLDIVFTAECIDATSGVDRVEFYVEDELVCNDSEEPFTWIPAQPDIYPLKVIAYDIAGNSNDEIPPGNTPDFYHFIGFILPPEYSATCIRFRAVFVFYKQTITSPDGPVVIDWIPVIGMKTMHLLNHYIGSIGTFFIHATFNDGQY